MYNIYFLKVIKNKYIYLYIFIFLFILILGKTYFLDNIIYTKNILELNFTNLFDGKLNKQKYKNIWGLENIQITKSGDIKIKYPLGSYKPSVKPRGGAGFIYLLGNGFESAKLSYKIKFAKNFNFVKGGKLPGLCGGTCPRGGASSINGFSTRFMWRNNGDIDLYAYIPNKKETMGKSFGRGTFRFNVGKTYKISQKITMNTPGKNDGLLIIYINGKEIYKNNNITFRNNEKFKIDAILFSTFFGGGDKSWSTPVDTNIIFSDFKLEY